MGWIARWFGFEDDDQSPPAHPKLPAGGPGMLTDQARSEIARMMERRDFERWQADRQIYGR